MKKILLISLGLFFIFIGIVRAGDVICDNYFVNVDTTGIIASPISIGRKYYLIVNIGDTNVVYHSSGPINASNYVAKGALPIAANYGFWEDSYYVNKSSWYICTASSSSTVAIREKE